MQALVHLINLMKMDEKLKNLAIDPTQSSPHQ